MIYSVIEDNLEGKKTINLRKREAVLQHQPYSNQNEITCAIIAITVSQWVISQLLNGLWFLHHLLNFINNNTKITTYNKILPHSITTTKQADKYSHPKNLSMINI